MPIMPTESRAFVLPVVGGGWGRLRHVWVGNGDMIHKDNPTDLKMPAVETRTDVDGANI